MSFPKKNIAAVVVFYNPDQKVVDNIKSYFSEISLLIVVDNSENSNLELLSNFDQRKIQYICLGENLGIAKALNIGLKTAEENGSDLLFTFDQDSFASEGMVAKMIEFANKTDFSQVGILTPFHNNKGYKLPNKNIETEELIAVATSGNLVNIKAAVEVGGFIEKLFIDYVDIEFCLRLKLNNYKIIQLNTAVLDHNLGNLIEKKFLWKKISVTNHSALRLYYRVRNRLFITKNYIFKFPSYVFHILRMTATDSLKVIFFEDDKFNKLKMMIIGNLHFILNKYGKYSSEK